MPTRSIRSVIACSLLALNDRLERYQTIYFQVWPDGPCADALARDCLLYCAADVDSVQRLRSKSATDTRIYFPKRSHWSGVSTQLFSAILIEGLLEEVMLGGITFQFPNCRRYSR